ncbi:MAG: FAD-dependent oxidoreductase [Desulfohalobiaceae bacterium]
MERSVEQSLEQSEFTGEAPSEEEIFGAEWDVVLVGSGVIGMWSALYLARSGARVLLLDDSEELGCCSEGNAGLLVPSRCKPLPGPGRIREGLKGFWGSRESPFSLRPGLDPDLWGWLARFVLSCSRNRFEAGSDTLLEMGRRSMELMEDELADREGNGVFLGGEGVLYPYYGRRQWIRAVHEARTRRGVGLDAHVLSAGEAREAEPALDPAVLGAVLQKADRRAEPEGLLSLLQDALQREGVTRLARTRVYALDTGPSGTVERVRTTRGALRAGQVLLAAGAGTKGILKSMGSWLPIRSGRGWSVTFGYAEGPPERGLLLEEARIGVAPWRNGFRVTGGLELSGGEEGILRSRVQSVLRQAKSYLPGLDSSGRPLVWQGNRPLTPDGLPAVGRIPGTGNLWVAAGHANLGLTLGAASGEMIAGSMAGSGEEPAYQLAPERFLKG